MRKSTWKKIGWALGGAALAVATGFQLSRRFFEEPPYQVVRREGAVEIRQYGNRVVAETTVEVRDRTAATSEGFSRLADYIFGGNESIAMTTPVESTPAEGQRIAMTTPVESTPGSLDGWTITFTMPSEYALEDLPTPRDERVRLREAPGRRVAALRFSGRVRDGIRREKEAELLERLGDMQLRPASEVTVAIYDPPSVVLSPFRRNEVMVDVATP